MQQPPSLSNGSTEHGCSPQVHASLILPLTCLSAVSLSYLWWCFFHQQRPRFSAKGTSQDIQTRQTRPYFRRERETCAHSHSNAHTSRHTGTCISAHTHRQRRERGRWWWCGRLRDRVRWGQGLCDKGTGTRCRLCVSGVVMFWVCVCVCAWHSHRHLEVWQTATSCL